MASSKLTKQRMVLYEVQMLDQKLTVIGVGIVDLNNSAAKCGNEIIRARMVASTN